ncbi:hypothetical protein [Aureimonas altamirensis]|uniref:hypothetical protein n=1 Tax=Aureimonas altamirensis TaxID=370622 RepID=UPI0018CF469A|nr:hypothetical protein [Aureimonas altamirensis]
MVAFNFQEGFAELVASGAKRQTIRRTARARVGDRVQLFTGQRTAACRKLLDPDPIVTRVTYCALRRSGITLGNVEGFPRDQDAFAQEDGFRDFDEMMAWFEGQYGQGEFIGFLTKWEIAPASPKPTDTAEKEVGDG